MTRESAAYMAVNFGAVGMSNAAALDYADKNICMNAICLRISDPMMDRLSGGTEEGRERVIAQEHVGRMGKPEEIAAAVLFLCSDYEVLGRSRHGVAGGQTTDLG